MKVVALFLMMLPFVVTAEALTINVTGVKPGAGDVRVGVFNGV